MTVSSGFFNSKKHDRVYDATQFSSFFDGLITDGVYQAIGDAFMVTPYADGNDAVLVGTGRAWFNKTWTVNDTPMLVQLDPPSSLLDRIDAIVLDIDRSEAVRQNSIKVVKGEYSESAKNPTLIHTDTHNQYPLAYVTMPHGDSAPIRAMYIKNTIGTSECPFVAGFLESLDITMFVSQLEDKFFYWFDDLKTNLSGDIAANLQNQINDLEEDVANASQGAISLDTLEKAKSVSVTVANVSHDTSGGQSDPSYREYIFDTMLPDGYILSICKDYKSGDYQNETLYAQIFNTDGVLQSETALFKGYTNDYMEYRSLLSIVQISDEFPYTLSFYWVVPKYTNLTPDRPSSRNRFDGITAYVGTITVTSTHIVNFNSSSKYFAQSIITGTPAGMQEYSSPFRAVKLNNGSYLNVSCFGGTENSVAKDFFTLAVHISSDFMVTSGEFIEDAFGKVNYSSWNSAPLYAYTSVATDVNSRIAVTAADNTYNSTPYTFLFNPDTGAYMSTQSSAYETDLKDIPVDGVGQIVSSATSIGVYSQRLTPTSTKDIPISTELSWSLDGSEAFSSWKSGVMDPDGRVLIIGNGSQVRVGVIPEHGLMVWSNPVSGSVFTSANDTKFNLLLPTKASWVSNSDHSKHYIFIRGNSKFTSGSSFPILPEIASDNSGASKIVKIDLGDW